MEKLNLEDITKRIKILSKSDFRLYERPDGTFGFIYEKPISYRVDCGGFYSFGEDIPEEISNKGSKAIENYLNVEIRRLNLEIVRRMRKKNKQYFGIKKDKISVKAEYKGKVLEGIIEYATSRRIQVELQKPFKASAGRDYGFATALAKRFIFFC